MMQRRASLHKGGRWIGGGGEKLSNGSGWKEGEGKEGVIKRRREWDGE